MNIDPVGLGVLGVLRRPARPEMVMRSSGLAAVVYQDVLTAPHPQWHADTRHCRGFGQVNKSSDVRQATDDAVGGTT